MILYRAALVIGIGFLDIGNVGAQSTFVATPIDADSLQNRITPSVAGSGGSFGTKQERTEAANPLWAVPIQSLSATRERPIFSPSRRPPPVTAMAPAQPAAAPPPAEPERPSLTLLGTVFGGPKMVGVFLDENTKDIVRLKIGDEHAGWTLRAVQRREASLEKNRRTVTVALPRPDAESKPRVAAPGSPIEMPVLVPSTAAAADLGGRASE